MGLDILPCRITDGAQIAHTLLEAYRGDPFTSRMYPGMAHEARLEGNTQRWPRNFIRGEYKRFIKVVDRDTDTLVCYAKWDLPTAMDIKWEGDLVAPATEEELNQFPDIEGTYQKYAFDGMPLGISVENVTAVGKALDEARDAVKGDRAFMTLDLLATIPTHQRCGAATLALRWGLALADFAQLPVYLDATPYGTALYERHGFQRMREVVHDMSRLGGEGWYTHVAMVREPVVREKELSAGWDGGGTGNG